jgi:pyruvate ferredoxin oxidoreductase beta subunit
VAHKPAYVATIIGAEPLDLAKKIETLQGLRGPRLLISLAPCPTGWDFDPRLTVEIGRLAVQTGIWPLKEFKEGRVVHTKIPKQRKPVEEYLKLQGRFRHLFEPERVETEISKIQARIDHYWDKAIGAEE